MHITLKKNETMQDLVERLKYSFEIVSDIAPIAYWYENLNENGRIKDIHFSDRMREMLGYKTLEEFPDELNTLMTFTHPDDVQIMLQGAIDAGTEKTDKYDVEYRIRKADGSYMWCNATGELVKDYEGKRVGMYGSFVNIDDEIKKQQRQLRETEEAEKLVESVASVYAFAFAVDLSNDYFRVIRMDETVKDTIGNRDFKNYWEAMIPMLEILHPADRKRMEHELDFETIRERIKETSSYNIEYRVLLNTETQWHEMKVTHIANDEVAMGFGEKDLEITKRHLEEERFSEYFGLYEVDLDTEMMKVLIDSPYYTFSETGAPVPYSEAMRIFAENQEGETRESFLKLADVDWVRKTLLKDNIHSFTYYSVTAGNTWVDVTSYVTARHDDGTPAMFALGYSFVSSTAAANQELQKQVNENSQIIRGLASGYMTVYYINIDENVFTVYALDRDKYHNLSRMVDERKNPFELLGEFGASDLVHPDDRYLFEHFSADDFRLRLAHQKRFNIRYRAKIDGTYQWNEMSVVKSEDIDERANSIIVAFADCDEEIRKEREHQQILQKALDLAEEANKSKTDFLFNMSHDIRTPMNAIIGFTSIAKKEINNPEKALDSLEKVQLSSEILLNLINDVLDMSRIESGKVELHEEKHEIIEAFDSFEPTMASLAASKDINLHFSVGEIRDRYIFVDGPRFDRILINIISNAIKYTPAEGFVRVSVDQIEDTIPGYGNYRFIVEDSGIGMSEKFQKHMFEEFAREENSTTSGIQGTGLGLTLAKKLMDMMGGTISCYSKQGVGTIFTLIFPFRLQTEEDIKNKVINVQQQSSIDLGGKRVLLVEDNELNREIVDDILSDEGVVVETAENGQKAVKMIRARKSDYYDFILMDIQMPVMDGYEATRTIHKLIPDFKTPIIALSANAFVEDKEKSVKAGMNDHIAKPINIEELKSALAKFLK